MFSAVGIVSRKNPVVDPRRRRRSHQQRSEAPLLKFVALNRATLAPNNLLTVILTHILITNGPFTYKKKERK